MRTEKQRFAGATHNARNQLEVYWIRVTTLEELAESTPQAYADANCTLTFQDWLDLHRKYPRCAYCNRPLSALNSRGNRSMDHIVPISRGGTHSKDNVLPICIHCNRAKHTSLLGEWLPWDWFPN